MSGFKWIVAGATAAAFVAGIGLATAQANERYQIRPHVGVSPDLAAPWLLQLQGNAARDARSLTQGREENRRANLIRTQRRVEEAAAQRMQVQQAAVPRVQAQPAQPVQRAAVPAPRSQPQISDAHLPQIVNYDHRGSVGDIIIDTKTRHLYLNLGNGQSKRYGVGVGKEGFEWRGTEKITRKAEWPSWRPPAEMIKRVRQKEGRILPAFMEGGPDNPLGARALYLGSTLYRIHGTNQPWTIGGAVSSGCIRMRNEDVIDLYERVRVGARVTVL